MDNPNVEILAKAMNKANFCNDKLSYFDAERLLDELEKQGYVLVKVNFNDKG